jgi:hypothetical protein
VDRPEHRALTADYGNDGIEGLTDRRELGTLKRLRVWQFNLERCKRPVSASSVKTNFDRLDLPAMPQHSRKQIYRLMFY